MCSRYRSRLLNTVAARISRPEALMTRATSATPSNSFSSITSHEALQVEQANKTGVVPVVFVHGLWLLPSSWDRWAALFQDAGFTTLTPGWPDDPETVAEANANPGVFAHKTVGQVADHLEAILRGLRQKPVVIGHSFGGLLAQILAGRGLARVTVAIDPAPFRGVLPLPLSSLKSAWPVLGNPANRNRAIPLTYERSEERRVGKECRARGSTGDDKKRRKSSASSG